MSRITFWPDVFIPKWDLYIFKSEQLCRYWTDSTTRGHMSSAAETVENASIISESGAHEGNRLWIGNIDPKITEYHLVKLLEKFGKVKQFDFLFHKSGPLEGQPRGYCFVNFNTREEAERAIQRLNGKLALSKKLVVRWAHAQVRVSDRRGFILNISKT